MTKFQAPSSNSSQDILRPKFSNFGKKLTEFVQKLSSNLLIIPYQLTKFQAPNSSPKIQQISLELAQKLISLSTHHPLSDDQVSSP